MSRLHLVALATVAALTAVTASFASTRLLHLTRATTEAPAARDGRMQQYWPGGVLKSDIVYRADVYDGEYRTFYASGAPYELRHYRRGHEEGLQQSWTEDGTRYLNYEVRDGRRYGLVNAVPCTVVGDPVDSHAPDAARPQPAAVARATQGQTAPETPGDLPYYDEADFTPHWSPVSHRVSPFELTTQEGRTLTSASLAGRPYVASFVYTRCAAVCPILVRQLARVQDALGAQARIVSFSVTPDSDTPQVLAAFGRDRGIDPRRWSLVTGSKHTIYTLARTSYFADDARVGTAPDDASAFLHSEKLLLVDAAGRLRGVYNGTQPHAVDQLVDDFRHLRYHASPE